MNKTHMNFLTFERNISKKVKYSDISKITAKLFRKKIFFANFEKRLFRYNLKLFRSNQLKRI